MIIAHKPDSARPVDVARHYIGDLVFGANDGLVTTFTVVSGVAGANLSPTVVLIIGFVNLLADGFSMGASNYLSIRSAAADRGYREPLLHGLATFGAFVLAGVLPLLAFMVPGAARHAFLVSALATGTALFVVGALRSAVVPGRTWLRCGLEMLGVGALAAAVAYGVGALLGAWVRR